MSEQSFNRATDVFSFIITEYHNTPDGQGTFSDSLYVFYKAISVLVMKRPTILAEIDFSHLTKEKASAAICYILTNCDKIKSSQSDPYFPVLMDETAETMFRGICLTQVDGWIFDKFIQAYPRYASYFYSLNLKFKNGEFFNTIDKIISADADIEQNVKNAIMYLSLNN